MHGVVRTDVHGKLDEIPAELRGVLPEDLGIYEEGTDEARVHLISPQINELDSPARPPAGRLVAKERKHQLRV